MTEDKKTEDKKDEKTVASENKETPSPAEESKPASTEEKAPAESKKPEEVPTPTPTKKKKINKMTLAEIEAKLNDIKKKLGGLDSKYAKHLLKRKEFLLSKKK